MKRIILILTALLLSCAALRAQDTTRTAPVDSTLVGKSILSVLGSGVQVEQSAPVRQALEKYTQANAQKPISGYRIRYAQELMRKRPDMPHADVAEAAGFSSRTAFLRTFKAQTGLTPSEWKRQEGLGNVF